MLKYLKQELAVYPYIIIMTGVENLLGGEEHQQSAL